MLSVSSAAGSRNDGERCHREKGYSLHTTSSPDTTNLTLVRLIQRNGSVTKWESRLGWTADTRITRRRERPLEQRRTSGGKAPKAGRVRRSPIRAKIIRFWHISTSQGGGDRFRRNGRSTRGRLHACRAGRCLRTISKRTLLDLKFWSGLHGRLRKIEFVLIPAALRGSDVLKPDDFGTAQQPANSVRFGCPSSAGPPLLQRSLSG
jgi:hypothetical protein